MLAFAQILCPSVLSEALCTYAAKHVPPVSLFASAGSHSDDEDGVVDELDEEGGVTLSIGYGEFELQFEGMRFTLQHLGAFYPARRTCPARASFPLARMKLLKSRAHQKALAVFSTAFSSCSYQDGGSRQPKADEQGR